MKGFSEQRGQAYRTEFDAESGQFVTRSVAHAFHPAELPELIMRQIAGYRIRRRKQKDKRELQQILAGMSPEVRDDVGMTEAFLASGQM